MGFGTIDRRMRHVALSIALCLLASTIVGGTTASPAGAEVAIPLNWVTTAGGTENDRTRATAFAPDGSVYAVGSFQDLATFGAGADRQDRSTIGAAVNRDGYVARYATDGTLEWLRTFGGDGDDEAIDVAVGSDGSIYVTGRFAGKATATPGVGTASTTLTSRGGYDAFIARYDAAGNLGLLQQAGGFSYDSGDGIAVASDGSLLVAGTFSNTATFGVWPSSMAKTSAGGRDGFLAKYSVNGVPAWVSPIASAGTEEAFGVAEAGGVVAVSARFTGSTTVGEGAGAITATGCCSLVARYDLIGNPQWARVGGGTAGQPTSVAVDSGGNVYYVGSHGNGWATSGSTSFETGSGTVDVPYVVVDGFLVRYNPTGALAWVNTMSGPSADSAADVVVAADKVAVTGFFLGTTSFTGTGPDDARVGEATDGFLARYGVDGAIEWIETITGRTSGHEQLTGVAHRSSAFAVAGSFSGPSTGGTQAILGDGEVVLRNRGFSDGMLAVYGTAGARSQLTATVASDPALTFAGAPASMTASVRNDGPGTASDVGVSGLVPPNFAISDTSASQGTINGSKWSVGPLASGASATITFTATPAVGTGCTYPVHRVIAADRGKTSVDSTGSETGARLVVDEPPPAPAGDVLATRHFGGAKWDEIGAVEELDDGSLVAVGEMQGPAWFGPPTDPAPSTDNVGGYVVRAAADGSVQWLSEIVASEHGTVGISDLAVSHDGGLYVLGTYSASSTSFGATATLPAGRGVFVARYRPDGSIDWVRRLSSDAEVADAAAIPSGAGTGVVVTGTFYGSSVTFADGTTLGTRGQWDGWAARVDAAGVASGVTQIGGTAGDLATAVDVAPDGTAVIAGTFNGTATFGTGPGAPTATAAAPSSDAYVARVNADGSFAWVRTATGGGETEEAALAVDAGGNAYLMLSFTGEATFGPGPGAGTRTAIGNYDVALAKYASDGAVQWTTTIAGTTRERVGDIKITAAGTPILVGTTWGPGVGDPSAPTTIGLGGASQTVAGAEDFLYVVQFDPATADPAWVRTVDGVGTWRPVLALSPDRIWVGTTTYVELPVPGGVLCARGDPITEQDADGIAVAFEAPDEATVGDVHTVLTDGSGGPASGVVVTLYQEFPSWVAVGPSKLTNAAGEATFTEVPPGRYTMRFFDLKHRYMRSWFRDRLTYKDADDIVVQAGQTTEVSVPLQPKPTGGIRGTVTSGGAPVANVVAQVFHPTSGFVASVATNENGKWLVGSLPPGTYTMRIVDPAAVYANEWWDNKALASNATPITVGTTFAVADTVLAPAG